MIEPEQNLQIKNMATKTPLYKTGLPFSEVLAVNLKDLNDRVKGKKASLLIIDGGVGEGKTTLAIHVLDYINKLNDKPEIIIRTEDRKAGSQIAMGGVDFLKKLRVCFNEKSPCIGYDEAGDFSKRGSLTRFNAMLNRTFETFRAFKCLVVVVLPNFNILDNNLFDNQIPRCLIHTHSRSKNYGEFSVYGLDEMNWIRFWMGKWPKHRTKAYGMVTPNYRGHFLDLSQKRSKELDMVSTLNKLDILKKSEVKMEGLLSYPELATKLDRSVLWVRKAVSNLKIKHSRIVERAKYFDPTIVNQLSELIEDTAPQGRPRKV